MVCALGAAPVAQVSAAPTVDPEATVIQELIVSPHGGGPAWWRVSNGDSTVYILGVPGALPRGLKWDQTVLRRRLQGANELIGPPVVTAGIGDLFALLNARKHFRSKGPMEAGLPADLKARFQADRMSLNPDPRAYSGWTPLVAGLLMIQDFRKQARLDPFQPAAGVAALARGQGVRVVPAGAYRAVPLVRAAESGLAAAGPACLTDALDEIEAGAGQVRTAAEGWARGDVSAALAAQRGYEKCLNSLPDGADLASRAMADSATTITAALARPGHSVAVVNLRTLLAQGGVLQRLQARGFRVGSPDG